MKVLQFLRLLELLLAQGRLGREAAVWSRLPLAVLMKSPGRLLQSPGRVLKSLGRVRLRQSPGQSSKSPCRLRDFLSRIRLFLAQAVRRWNPTLETA